MCAWAHLCAWGREFGCFSIYECAFVCIHAFLCVRPRLAEQCASEPFLKENAFTAPSKQGQAQNSLESLCRCLLHCCDTVCIPAVTVRAGYVHTHTHTNTNTQLDICLSDYTSSVSLSVSHVAKHLRKWSCSSSRAHFLRTGSQGLRRSLAVPLNHCINNCSYTVSVFIIFVYTSTFEPINHIHCCCSRKCFWDNRIY